MRYCVSIIIPVYNAANFIVNCLKSVINQTMTDGVECIIIDDCGSDNSVKLIEDFVECMCQQMNNELSLNFKLFHQEYNQGPSAARNRGIFEASGEYVFFLDADDTITPTCIATLYALAKENKLDYVQGCYKGESRKISSDLIFDRKEIKCTLLNYNLIPFTPHNRLVRRQMLIDYNLYFNETIRVREDFLWMTFVAKYVERFGYCSEVTYIRGYNEDSLTHNLILEREIKGYSVLIKSMIDNIDEFQRGAQMELILSAIEMFRGISDSEVMLCQISSLEILFLKQNNFVEKLFYRLYVSMKSRLAKIYVLRVLIRIYKLKD